MRVLTDGFDQVLKCVPSCLSRSKLRRMIDQQRRIRAYLIKQVEQLEALALIETCIFPKYVEKPERMAEQWDNLDGTYERWIERKRLKLPLKSTRYPLFDADGWLTGYSQEKKILVESPSDCREFDNIKRPKPIVEKG